MTLLRECKEKFLKQFFSANPKAKYSEIYDAAKSKNLSISSMEIISFKKANGMVMKQKTTEEKRKQKDAFLYSYFTDVNPTATYQELREVAAKQGITLDSVYISKFRKSFGTLQKRRPKELCDKLTSFIKARLNFKTATLIGLIKSELNVNLIETEISYFKHKAKKLLKTIGSSPDSLQEERTFTPDDVVEDNGRNSKAQKEKFAFTLAYFDPKITVEQINTLIEKEFGFILNVEYIKASIAKVKEVDQSILDSYSNCLFTSNGMDLSKIHPLALKYVEDMEILFKIVKAIGPQIEAIEKNCNHLNQQLQEQTRDLHHLKALPEVLTMKLKTAVAKL